jgi:hypothetical protein
MQFQKLINLNYLFKKNSGYGASKIKVRKASKKISQKKEKQAKK